MWKKPEERPLASPASPPEQSQSWHCEQKSGERALIGPSISIKGVVEGAEDIVIQGYVEGHLMFRENVVTIGKNGRVAADIHARVITVEGDVVGDLYGEEKVVVHRSGNVKGNIVCSRVTLEDGAKLKGTIDMDPGEGKKELPAVDAEDAVVVENRVNGFLSA